MSRPTASPARIQTLDSLREHLQWAIELEHATLPPYLCALYSLDPARNPIAVDVVGGVFSEEMLHLALAANLLNAVGGLPRLDAPEMLPPFPRTLPHGDRSLELSLVPFGAEALEMFLRIEQPAQPGAPEESDGYETIGQFYSAIEDGLRDLCARLGEQEVFAGDPARQVTSGFRHSAGKLVAVTDLASALAALKEIVEQGEGMARDPERAAGVWTDERGGPCEERARGLRAQEGRRRAEAREAPSGARQFHTVWDGDRDVFNPDREEVAHYYRFEELKLGRLYQRGDTPRTGPTGDEIPVDLDGVRPMRRNPRLTDHDPGSPIRAAQEEFNHTYCSLLHQLDQAFNGNPTMLGAAVGTMYALKSQAQALMRMPDEGGRTAGPTFDYVPPELRR